MGSIYKMTHEARELTLFIENDHALYRQAVDSFIPNVKRKLKKGVYNHKKAQKLWMYLVERGMREYARQFGNGGSGKNMFDAKARRQAAAYLSGHYLREIKLGNY